MLDAGRYRRDALAPLLHPPRRPPSIVAVLRAGVAPQLHHAVEHACRDEGATRFAGVSQGWHGWPHTGWKSNSACQTWAAPVRTCHCFKES